MKVSLLDLVTFLACLATIAAFIAGAIRYLQNTFDDYEESGRRRVVIGGTVAAILVIVIIGTVISHAAAATPLGQTSVQIGRQQATATSTATMTLTATSAPVATATPTLGPFPTSGPDYNALTPYSSGIIMPNWRLDCGGCDERVRVMVSQVTTDAGNENMVWTFTFDNHTADDYNDVRFRSLKLTDPNGVQHVATGAAMDGNGSSDILRAGKTESIQATFGFLPRHGGVYTLSAYLEVDQGLLTYYYTTYGPQKITF